MMEPSSSSSSDEDFGKSLMFHVHKPFHIPSKFRQPEMSTDDKREGTPQEEAVERQICTVEGSLKQEDETRTQEGDSDNDNDEQEADDPSETNFSEKNPALKHVQEGSRDMEDESEGDETDTDIQSDKENDENELDSKTKGSEVESGRNDSEQKENTSNEENEDDPKPVYLTDLPISMFEDIPNAEHEEYGSNSDLLTMHQSSFVIVQDQTEDQYSDDTDEFEDADDKFTTSLQYLPGNMEEEDDTPVNSVTSIDLGSEAINSTPGLDMETAASKIDTCSSDNEDQSEELGSSPNPLLDSSGSIGEVSVSEKPYTSISSSVSDGQIKESKSLPEKYSDDQNVALSKSDENTSVPCVQDDKILGQASINIEQISNDEDSACLKSKTASGISADSGEEHTENRLPEVKPKSEAALQSLQMYQSLEESKSPPLEADDNAATEPELMTKSSPFLGGLSNTGTSMSKENGSLPREVDPHLTSNSNIPLPSNQHASAAMSRCLDHDVASSQNEGGGHGDFAAHYQYPPAPWTHQVQQFPQPPQFAMNPNYQPFQQQYQNFQSFPQQYHPFQPVQQKHYQPFQNPQGQQQYQPHVWPPRFQGQPNFSLPFQPPTFKSFNQSVDSHLPDHGTVSNPQSQRMAENASPSLEGGPGMTEPKPKMKPAGKDRKKEQSTADRKSANTPYVQKHGKNTGRGVKQSLNSNIPAGGKDSRKSGVQKTIGVGLQDTNSPRTNQMNSGSREKAAKSSQLKAVPQQNVKAQAKVSPTPKKKTNSLPPGTTPDITKTMAAEATRSYMYMEGLNPNMSGDCLKNFIEAAGAVEVLMDQVVFSRDSTRAIVAMKGQIVVKDIEKRISSRGIEGYKPSVSTVDPPDCIAVSSEEEIQNPGSMFLYFESKKSGGGEVRTEEVQEADDCSCYIIQFMEHAVVERLCSRSEPHEWNHTQLRVSTCYKSPQGYMWDTKLHIVPIPTPVDVTLPHTHVQYLTKCDDLEQYLLQEYVQLSPGADRTMVQLICALTPDVTQFKSRVRSWSDDAKQHLQSYVDCHISEKKFKCVSKDPEKHNDEVWKRVTAFCRKEVTQDQKVVVDYDKSARKITLVGSEEIVKKKYERLQEKLTEVDREVRRTKEWRKMKTKEHVALLTRMESFKAVGVENVDVNIKTSGAKVGVEGVPEDIAAVFCKIFELSGTIVCNKRVTAMSNDLVDLIGGSDTLKQTISDAIEDTGVIAEWKVKSSDESNAEIAVWIEGRGESDVVADVIIGSVKETMVKYEKADDYLLQEQAWRDLRNEHSKLKSVLHFAFGSRLKPGIRVMGLKEHVDKAEQKLKKFFEENSLRKELVQCGTIEIKFLEKFCKAYLSDVMKQLQQYKVKLDIRGTDTVSICGNRQGLVEARKELKQKFDSIISEKFSLKKVAIQQVYNTERDRGTIGTVETLTSCLIQREGEQETHSLMTERASTSQAAGNQGNQSDSDDDDVPRHPVRPRPVPRPQYFTTPNGLVIKHIKGEIGEQTANVLVVSTAPNLNLSSGAATKSLLKQGSPELQQNCKDTYPEPIKSGEVAVVRATGALECSHVYLVNLPAFRTDEPVAKQTLSDVMSKCLTMASKHGKRNIAFCALGTGQLHFPVDVVASTMYEAVVDFSRQIPKTSLKEIHMVLYPKDTKTIKGFEDELERRLTGTAPKSSPSTPAPKQVTEIKFGPITVQYAVQKLADQKVDALLCSASESLNLSQSGAAKELLQVGGQSLQDECKSKYSGGLKPGQVAEIGGGQLSCKTVFLTVLEKYEGEASLQRFHEVLHTCLTLANSKKLTSLAMPVMGTGFLRYPVHTTCSTMYQAVNSWAANNKSTSIKTVRFILFYKDRQSIQTFADEVRKQHTRSAPRKRNFQAYESSPDTPYKAGPDFCKINNIRVTISQGDILEQKADAVIISVNPSKEGQQGAVYKAAVKTSQTLEAEYQKKVSSKGSQLVMSVKSPDLKAHHVLFIQYQDRDWTKVLGKCLDTAEKKKWKQIALPVLGTGRGYHSMRPSTFTEQLFDAINLFSKKHKVLNRIQLVVFDKGHFDPIIREFHKKCQKEIGKGAPGLKDRFFNFLGFGGGENKSPSAAADQNQKQRDNLSSLHVVIYSDKKDNIKRCKTELEARLEKEYYSKPIDDHKDLVKSLSKEEEGKLLPPDCIVDLVVDKPSGIIKISGPIQNVINARDHAQSVLRSIHKHREQVKNADTLYEQVQWCYEEVTLTERKRKPYDKLSNFLIEMAYKNNDEQKVLVGSDGSKCVIDFKSLQEYPQDDPTDTVTVIRTDILKSKMQKEPSTWTPMKENEYIRKVNVDSTSKEYTDLATRFVKEIQTGPYSSRITWNKSNLKVTKIERIQNKTLYQQYKAKKEVITNEKQATMPPNMPIERDLWHGTTPEAVDSIIKHGFNRSYCGKNGIWFGAGVYFAADASYSARGWLTSGNNSTPVTSPFSGQLFLAKAVTGRICKGDKTMRYLPPIDPAKPLVLYDSAVDDPQKPLEFVIFHDTQCYPEYLLSFSA